MNTLMVVLKLIMQTQPVEAAAVAGHAAWTVPPATRSVLTYLVLLATHFY